MLPRVIMRLTSLRVLCLSTSFTVLVPALASAQIISTMIPTLDPGAPGGRRTAVHGMGGLSNWDFGGLDQLREFLADEGGSLAGGQRGFIFAGDVAQRVGQHLSVGGGGWMNTVADQVRDVLIYSDQFPGGHIDTISRRVYSLYGNVFFKNIGAQVGMVPFRSTIAIFDPVYLRAYEGDISQNDLDVFGVGRIGSRHVSATVGAGIYRYGTRNLFLIGAPVKSPASTVFSAFGNGSFFVFKQLSVDVSFWYTAADKNEFGNDSQARFTIGMGIGR
jgi:hypothetical protein